MSGSEIQLELTNSLWLAALVSLPVLFYYFYCSLVDFPRWQRWWSLAIRALIILLLVLSLAGMNLVRTTHEQFVVFLLDRSVSVGQDSAAKADQFVNSALPFAGPHRTATLGFDREPGVLQIGGGKPAAPMALSGDGAAVSTPPTTENVESAPAEMVAGMRSAES